MRKIINAPNAFVDETIEGILTAHPRQLRAATPDKRGLARADTPIAGKVAIITGGGSGHLPLFLGYVGRGLCDAVCIGNVFASPSASQMLTLTKAVHSGAGVLYLYGNYQGDTLHFGTAAEMAELDGIETRTILASDDVASAPPEQWTDRRGIAGIFFAYKAAGAKAEEGADLDAVTEIAQRTVANTRTMGVALAPCILPEVGVPNFSVAEGEMEVGMGIHGEPGVSKGPLATADDIAASLTNSVLADLPFQRGDEVCVLINGLGATPLEELYIVLRKVAAVLGEAQIAIHRSFVGEFATSLEMAGCSVSLLKLDDELKRLIDAPADSPFYAQH